MGVVKRGVDSSARWRKRHTGEHEKCVKAVPRARPSVGGECPRAEADLLPEGGPARRRELWRRRSWDPELLSLQRKSSANRSRNR